MNKKIGIYPGTFDPITNGHIDIIIRSLKIVDTLIISIANHSNKKPLFSLDERISMIKKDIKSIKINKNKLIKVAKFNGLLTSFAKKNKADCIIRGLRAVSDFEYEFQMTGMNYHLNSNIETIFLMSTEKNLFISSKFIKEVHNLGGNVANFVSQFVLKQLNKKNK
tara:strand:+ start:772 stop:1269 length:498 start_codon:yes stop_codon:yes gene_type:complete